MKRWLLLIVVVAGCQTRPTDIPEASEQEWMVVVKSARLPFDRPALTRFAHHTWFDIKKGSEEDWFRVEVFDSGFVDLSPISAEVARADLKGTRKVSVWRIVTGPDLPRLVGDLELAAAAYPNHGVYRPWPGPNSNTFVASVGHEVKGLAFPLHHNAIGKDDTTLFRIAATTMKSGVSFDTLPLGVALDLREGVELHFFGLTFGVSIVRPALKLPFLPRLGAHW